ncbi:hypothetical protein ACI2K4_30760 [Micromonospora sp. NPDC050397]|uniref:hypothetical protein n=1 Tax=Micromonospora sp. NPDC050397 TaxID=3364279 RepID=UPI00384B0C40
MSRNDEATSPTALAAAAVRTIEGHADGRRCLQCRPDGCRQMAWALTYRAQHSEPVSPGLLLLPWATAAP